MTHGDPELAEGARRNCPISELLLDQLRRLLYHLALGATPDELHYVYERDLQVLPTFAVVIATLRMTEPPSLVMPGIDIDLAAALHGQQDLTIHRPLPVEGRAMTRHRIVDVYDKGRAAIIVGRADQRIDFTEPGMSIFVRGEGGFGGERGPSRSVEVPDREPDEVSCPSAAAGAVVQDVRRPQPDPCRPEVRALAGFPKPILHGLCTYGMVGKGAVDTVLDGDPSRVTGYPRGSPAWCTRRDPAHADLAGRGQAPHLGHGSRA